MVHVKVGETHVINIENVRERDSGETAFPAVEQQPLHGLPAVHFHKQGIVRIGQSKNAEIDAHASSLTCPLPGGNRLPPRTTMNLRGGQVPLRGRHHPYPNMLATVLIVDDEKNTRDGLRLSLEDDY